MAHAICPFDLSQGVSSASFPSIVKCSPRFKKFNVDRSVYSFSEKTQSSHGLSSSGKIRRAAVFRPRRGSLVVWSANAVKNSARSAEPLPSLHVEEATADNSRVKLTVTVPPERCGEMWTKTIREISKNNQFGDFRKGERIPDWLVIREVGEKQIKLTTLDSLLQSTLPEALASVAGRALKESEHILTKVDDLLSQFSPTTPLVYEIAVDVVPEVKWRSERAYAALAVEVEVDADIDEAAAAAAEDQLKFRLKDLGQLKISIANGLQMGEVAIVDIAANRILLNGEKGDPILSATQNGFQLDTEQGKFLLPGLVEKLLGMVRGETRDFQLAFPTTWQQEALRGVSAAFRVTCKEIFVRELPELTDDLAEKFLPGAKTIEEVREKLVAGHKDRLEKEKEQATFLAITEALGEVCDMEVPHSLLEEQGRQMYAAKLIELQAGGKLKKEDMTSLTTEAMVQNYLRAQKDNIAKQVRQALAVQEVFRAEKLTYEEEELKAEVASAIEEFERFHQEYDKDRVREQASELLEGAKVLAWLKENSSITYVPKSG